MNLYIVARILSSGKKGYRLLDYEENRTKDVTVEGLFAFISKGGYIQNLDSVSKNDSQLPLIKNGEYINSVDRVAIIIRRDTEDLLKFWIYDRNGIKLLPDGYIANIYNIVIGAKEINLMHDKIYHRTYLLPNETYEELMVKLYEQYGNGQLKLSGKSKEKAVKARERKNAIGDCRYTINDDGVFTLDNADNIKIMIIPEGVVSINNFAKSSICSIRFPSSLRQIEKNAFFMCRNLEKIDLSNTDVMFIEDGAFSWCDNVKTIKFSKHLYSIGEDAFLESGVTELEIPEGVAKISRGCFQDCSLLSSIKFNEGLKVIESMAFFQDCELKDQIIDIPNSVEYIASNAFERTNCKVRITKNVKNYAELIERPEFILR